jgi:hypothetical protein
MNFFTDVPPLWRAKAGMTFLRNVIPFQHFVGA